jgi:hypothetical protein
VYEFVPLVGGVIAALLVQPVPTAKLKVAALVLLCTVFGTVATVISGEIFVSPLTYLAFDITQALLAAGVTTLLVALLRRWRTPPLR